MGYYVDIAWYRKNKRKPYWEEYGLDSYGYTLNSYDVASDYAFMLRRVDWKDGDRVDIFDGSERFSFRASTFCGTLALTPIYNRGKKGWR